ncbi:MAG: hypothetical protein M3P18_11005 [Actinomycetota bacterium]|nr:hypothetical protein [Actinomycetota bacterium]
MTTLVISCFASTAAAAQTTLECGLFRNYTAPDPIAVTAGSITFGLNGSPEPIAPDATLIPPADTALPSLQGGTPTCLTVTRDAGMISSLAFAPSGTVSGTVILVPDLFGSGQDAYVIADRVFAPVAAVIANDGLAALIKTAADSGSIFSVTFQIDLSSGVPTGFTATTTLSGPVTAGTGGDIQVGAATLPNAVIDAAARASLDAAAGFGVAATAVVDGVGTLDQSSPGGVVIDVTLSVTYTAPAVASPTPTASATPTSAALPNTAITPTPSRVAPALAAGLLLLLTSLLTALFFRRLQR